jgi:hypothetical protein
VRPLTRLGSAGLVSGLSLLLAAAVAGPGTAGAARVPRNPQVRAAAHLMPSHYTVRRGDTLSKIARRFYGHADRWPALWWVNRHRVGNPNAIATGERLRLSAWHPDRPWLDHKALAAIPKPKPAPARHVPSAPAPSPAAPASSPAPAPATASAGAPGSFEQCVIARESGGDPAAVNSSSGAGGLYGFLPSTWASLGHSGLPNQASTAEQRQAFQQLYAQEGTAPWAPYDGC